MLERLLKRELEAQIALINDRDLRGFFGNQQRFSDTEIATVERVFAAQRPNVVIGYPRKEVNLPVYSIQLMNEREYQPGTFLGDNLGVIDAEGAADLYDATLLGGEILGAMFMRELAVMIYSTHPDTCLYMYELAKRCLMLARPRFNEEGALRTIFFGEDLEPVQGKIFDTQAGDWLFRRVLRLQTIELFEIGAGPDGLISEISGIHVSGGSTNEPIQVTSRVDSYTETED